eukprot:922489-Prymnesium_polylepis.2
MVAQSYLRFDRDDAVPFAHWLQRLFGSAEERPHQLETLDRAQSQHVSHLRARARRQGKPEC